MRRFLKKLRLLLLPILAVSGFAFAWSGLFNVAASRCHLPGLDWLLHYVKRPSVETHARSIEAPPLDGPALVHRGAGLYELVCAFCHGRPGQARSPAALSMTPPPLLVPGRTAWRPRELFWIVKHGIKFTGMPAWPSQVRDDEVWAMVAFLLRLPDMTPATCRDPALGEPAGERTPRPRPSDPWQRAQRTGARTASWRRRSPASILPPSMPWPTTTADRGGLVPQPHRPGPIYKLARSILQAAGTFFCSGRSSLSPNQRRTQREQQSSGHRRYGDDHRSRDDSRLGGGAGRYACHRAHDRR